MLENMVNQFQTMQSLHLLKKNYFALLKKKTFIESAS